MINIKKIFQKIIYNSKKCDNCGIKTDELYIYEYFSECGYLTCNNCLIELNKSKSKSKYEFNRIKVFK